MRTILTFILLALVCLLIVTAWNAHDIDELEKLHSHIPCAECGR
jgi:HAMP domain-containing protein